MKECLINIIKCLWALYYSTFKIFATILPFYRSEDQGSRQPHDIAAFPTVATFALGRSNACS